MKRKILNLAVAAALGSVGATASAVPYDANDAAIEYDVHYSGATASAQFVRNSLIDRACDPAGAKDITVFQRDGDDYVVVCQLLPGLGGDTVRHIKQGGGSGDGTTPVSQPVVSPLAYPRPAAGFNPAASCAAPVNTQTGAGTPFVFYNNCNIPNVTINGGDIGTSDLEPKLFFDVNTPSTGIAFSAADAAALDVKPLAGLAFGLPMTEGLRNALQALQFSATHPCHPSNPEWNEVLPTTVNVDPNIPGEEVSLDVARVAAGTKNPSADASPSLGVARVKDSELCMPNMTQAEVAGIMTGRLRTWDQIQRKGTTLVAAATAAGLPVPTTSGVPTLNNRRVHVCRRNDGSGTQAQFNAFFLARPCMSINGQFTAEQPLTGGNSTCSYNANSVVCNNRGSSDVSRCLDDLEKNATTSGLFNNTDASPLNNSRYAWAIGVQSTEVNPNLQFGFRFAKVDGLAPSIDNVYRADYTDHYEQTCQIRKSNSTIDPRANGAVVRQLWDTVCTAGPVDIFEANLNFLHPWGTGGWLSVPLAATGTAQNPDAPTNATALMDPNNPLPINSWTRRGESCSAPTVFDPVNATLEGQP